MSRTENVVHSGPGHRDDCPCAQVPDEELLVLVSLVTYGSMKRRAVRPAVSEFPELTDDTV
ncbi:hypothetical protein [Streptomyces flaveolus]|uniref:hypothetical protein n=1 Tax=Streptomyces flaveolus TaxID=67297 RepID=UPI003318FACF